MYNGSVARGDCILTSGDLGRPLRVLLIGSRWLASFAFEHLLEEQGVTALIVDVGAALAARDGPLVVFHVERWDGEAARIVHRLVDHHTLVVVISPDATDLAVVIAMLESGAVDTASEAPLALRALALKVKQRMGQCRPLRWQIGALIFDTVTECLSYDGRQQQLTQCEAQLLWCLYEASTDGGKLKACQLAHKLGKSDASIWNHISHLRGKIENDLQHQPVLLCDLARGYYLKLD